MHTEQCTASKATCSRTKATAPPTRTWTRSSSPSSPTPCKLAANRSSCVVHHSSPRACDRSAVIVMCCMHDVDARSRSSLFQRIVPSSPRSGSWKGSSRTGSLSSCWDLVPGVFCLRSSAWCPKLG
eukprot:2974283-Rhodomonas_salina.1